MENNISYPVLFLDIDGVLNSRRSAAVCGGYPHSFSAADMTRFDPLAIALVRRLCVEADAVIVLSSSWRYEFSPEECAEALDLPIIDCTPMPPNSDYDNRGYEIAAWLSAHPGVHLYAIVDDINAMLPVQQPHFVCTDDAIGLTLADYERLRHILLKGPKLS